jgi:hypothetical protein
MISLILLCDIFIFIRLSHIVKLLILLRDIYSIISLTLIMKVLILLWDIYSIISLTLIMKALILLRDIYSIIETINNSQQVYKYQYRRWYCKYPSVRPQVSMHTMKLSISLIKSTSISTYDDTVNIP